jgi:hypothetical protein
MSTRPHRLRVPLSICCILLALLLCLLALSASDSDVLVTVPAAKGRLALRAAASGIAVRSSRIPASNELAAAAEAIDRLRNGDVRYQLETQRVEGGWKPHFCRAECDWYHMHVERVGLSKAAAEWACLQALEDPTRFAAAHVALSFLSNSPVTDSVSVNGSTHVANIDGLVVTLRPKLPDRPPDREIPTDPPDTPEHLKYRGPFFPGGERRMWDPIRVQCQGPEASVDASQIPLIRRRWQDRLHSELLVIPYWLLIIALITYPAVTCIRVARNIHARKHGLCPNCRYDLRSGHERCPECGWQVVGAEAGKAGTAESIVTNPATPA